MITITFFAKEIEKKDKVNLETITGFRTKGHAEYAEYGEDIVCAAVSALVMNTMESIRLLSSDVFDYEEDEEKGISDFRIISDPTSPETKVLFQSLVIGLKGIQDEYGKKYLRIVFQNS
ncbi:MAG: ribosomal-processing cysteine protease Prp [Lachnospiraceae bacterium]|nr:ribosomal-processing cysteine protease Prp [Lachnospiraceae bacterium]